MENVMSIELATVAVGAIALRNCLALPDASKTLLCASSPEYLLASGAEEVDSSTGSCRSCPRMTTRVTSERMRKPKPYASYPIVTVLQASIQNPIANSNCVNYACILIALNIRFFAVNQE